MVNTLVIAAISCVSAVVSPGGLQALQKGQERTQLKAPQVGPGLAFRVISANIDKTGIITVQYRVMDQAARPLDITGKQTPGIISVSHQAGFAPNGESYFSSYSTRPPPVGRTPVTLGSEDSGGTLAAVGFGEYLYTFATKAPDGWDPTATHRIAVHGLRDLKPWGLGVTYADTTFDFVPAGGTPQAPEVYRHCNNCHGRSQAAPDGSPRSERLCIMCHTQQKCAS